MKLEMTIHGNRGEMATREDMIAMLRLLAEQLAVTNVVNQDMVISDRAGVRCGHVRITDMPRPVVALEIPLTHH